MVIGNTNPGSTDKIIKEVLIEIAENMTGENKLEEPLDILEVECLTKPRTDGSRIWSRISLESTCNVQRPILLDGLPGNTSHQGSKDQQFQHSIQAQQHSHLKRGQILITKYGF